MCSPIRLMPGPPIAISLLSQCRANRTCANSNYTNGIKFITHHHEPLLHQDGAHRTLVKRNDGNVFRKDETFCFVLSRSMSKLTDVGLISWHIICLIESELGFQSVLADVWSESCNSPRGECHGGIKAREIEQSISLFYLED